MWRRPRRQIHGTQFVGEEGARGPQRQVLCSRVPAYAAVRKFKPASLVTVRSTGRSFGGVLQPLVHAGSSGTPWRQDHSCSDQQDEVESTSPLVEMPERMEMFGPWHIQESLSDSGRVGGDCMLVEKTGSIADGFVHHGRAVFVQPTFRTTTLSCFQPCETVANHYRILDFAVESGGARGSLQGGRVRRQCRP